MSRVVQIPPMVTANDVYVAIRMRQPSDPNYVRAVLRSYINVKFARGKTKYEVSIKLEPLEVQFPQHVREFHAVRAEYSLPKSRIFPAMRDTPIAPSTTRRYTHTGPAPSTLTNNTLGRVRTTPGVTTTRPVPVEEDEPPPPPYASQDPEPDSTRLLQQRLAAEAEAASISPIPLGGPSTLAAPISSASPRPSPRHSISAGSNATPQSPPVMVYQTPPRSGRASLVDRPGTPPVDAEDAEIREQSLLEEAKRASKAEERERLELEQAMQLSLAEAEADQIRQLQEADAGPSRQYMPALAEDEDEVHNSRRASSYHALGLGGTGEHRRAASDARGTRQDLIQGMSTLSIPGGWQNGSSSNNREEIHEDLMDIPDYSALAQEPISPMKTGPVIKSNNPFLSPQEREQLDSALPPAPSASTSNDWQNYPRNPSLVSESQRETPGSGYTAYSPPNSLSSKVNKKLPRPPSSGSALSYSGPSSSVPWDGDEPKFEPPPGPPPSHLVLSLPNGPPPLPVRPEITASNREGVVSPALKSSKSMIGESGEDPLEMLREFDTVFLVDDSTSMAGGRWSQARGALMEVAEIAARYDENGVDIYFLNNKRVGKELRTGGEVEDLFRGLEPRGATPTGLRMEAILRDYMAKLERSVSAAATPGAEPVKPMNLIVVTDGVFARPVSSRLRILASDPNATRDQLLSTAPTDDPESVLVNIAKRLDRGEFPLSQVGIQLLQIGDDSEAREALQELDDGLADNHGIRDIVDTVPYDGEEMSAKLIVKVLLGGINRRLDRRRTA